MNQCLHVSRVFLFFVFLLFTIRCHAGNVRGTVKDPLDAVIVNANIELRAGKKTIAAAVTDSEGKFQLNAGQGGRFYLHAMAATFAPTDSDSFYLGEADAKTENISLRAPNLVQQIVVTATGVPTSQAQVGASVTVLAPQEYLHRLDV